MVQSQDSEQLLLQQQLPTFPTFLCPDPDWPDHDTSGQLGQVFPDEQNLLQRYGSSNSLSDLSLGHLSSPREHHLLDRKGATMPLPVESPGGFLDNTLASMLDRQLMLSASAPVGYTFPSTSGLSEGAGLLNMAAQRDAFRTLTEEDVFSSCGGLELGAEAALGGYLCFTFLFFLSAQSLTFTCV